MTQAVPARTPAVNISLLGEVVWNERQVNRDVWNLGRRDQANAGSNWRERWVVKTGATEV